MKDETLQDLALRLQLDLSVIKNIKERLQPQSEQDLIRAVNDYKAIVAESGAKPEEALNFLIKKQSENTAQQNSSQTSQFTAQPQQTQQQPSFSPQTPSQGVPANTQPDSVGADFYKKYQQGYQFRPTDGAGDLGGQCAWFAEQVTQLPDGSNWTIGSTAQEKQNQLRQHVQQGNAFFKGQETPKVGESVVFGGGKYGHVAVVSEVLPDGKLRLTEANYNNDLKVRHDRIIDPNDPSVMGFVKTQPKQEFSIKPVQEVRQDLAKQGVKTNETTPAQPQLAQNVDPNNPAEQKMANTELKQVNDQQQKNLEAETKSLPENKEQTPSQTDVPNGQYDQLLSQIPEGQRPAAAKAIPELASALKDEGILTPKTLAYAVATVQHESGFVPKSETMAQRGLNPRNDYIAGLQENYSGGKDFHGRGYIQLTHDYNYKKFGDRIGEDLVNNPDKLLDPKVSAKVLAAFFKDNGVAQSVENGDYTGARVRVQGKGATNTQFMPTTQQIGQEAQKYQSVLGDNIDKYLSKDQPAQDKVGTITQQTDALKKTTDDQEDNDGGIITPASQIAQQTDQQKIDKGVERNDIFTQARKQSDQLLGKASSPVSSSKNFLSVFSGAPTTPEQNAPTTPKIGGAEGAIQQTQQQKQALQTDKITGQANQNKNIFQNYSTNVSAQTGQGTNPNQTQQFQNNVQQGNVLFTPAVNQANQVKQALQNTFQDPLNAVKGLVTSGENSLAQGASRLIGSAFSALKKPEEQPQQQGPSAGNSSSGNSFSGVRQQQANTAFSSASKPAAVAKPAAVSKAVAVKAAPKPVAVKPAAVAKPAAIAKAVAAPARPAPAKAAPAKASSSKSSSSSAKAAPAKAAPKKK